MAQAALQDITLRSAITLAQPFSFMLFCKVMFIQDRPAADFISRRRLSFLIIGILDAMSVYRGFCETRSKILYIHMIHH